MAIDEIVLSFGYKEQISTLEGVLWGGGLFDLAERNIHFLNQLD